MALDPAAVVHRTERSGTTEIQPTLTDYIRIPAVSVGVRPGLGRARPPRRRRRAAPPRGRRPAPSPGSSVEVVRLPGRTPVLWFEVPAFGPPAARRATPSCSTATSTSSRRWPAGARAWGRGSRCVVGDRLYGRGGADDGYAAFASLAAIEAVQAEGGHHARCVGLIECSEESGSPDLPAYVDAPRRPHRHAEPGRLPRLVLRRLRAPVDHHLAARPGRRPPHGRGAHRGRALRQRRAGWCPTRSGSLRRLLDRVEDARHRPGARARAAGPAVPTRTAADRDRRASPPTWATRSTSSVPATSRARARRWSPAPSRPPS